jgi:hypothetical protein
MTVKAKNLVLLIRDNIEKNLRKLGGQGGNGVGGG